MSESKFAIAKTVVSTIGSIAATSLVVRGIARDYLPQEIQNYLHFNIRVFINKLFRHLTMVIYEFDGIEENELYNATTLYLASRISHDIHRLKVTKTPSQKNINVAMEINDEFVDVYNGVNFKWCLSYKTQPTVEYRNYDDMGGCVTKTDQRSLELTKEKLDAALLRPGRMDVHINMSYCTPSGFRLLASNYLGITQHDVFKETEDLIREVKVTPAEVAEQLLKKDDPDSALSGLVAFFGVKRKENEEIKAKTKRKQEELIMKEGEKNEIVSMADESDQREEENGEDKDEAIRI
ncbi:hypothetical protein QVD17_36970 [Tagetes erecta]|uniref:AAA-type ATPase N-terminal domain-containing protein n=1 Tax=Tagetes erecta TaxID=13708 RepID=A0AAD8NJN0_TARER|nr:hypothetical protein QVD17_36970 [Tagetes erecta]